MKNLADSSKYLLSVKNLCLEVDHLDSKFFVVQDLNFNIKHNEIFALVGESGSGKTLTALSLIGLLPNQVKWIKGEIAFQNKKIDINSQHLLRSIRGKHISFIFQNAHAALNPVFCVGKQIKDVITTNLGISKKDARILVLELFEQVNFTQPDQIYKCYPHQLSGGMAQRIMIAMALSCNPKLIIADEPTTALDVTTQISIFQLIESLQRKNGFSLFLISHDLQVVSALADKIAVLKNGKIIECAGKNMLLHNPQNNYTKLLLASFLNHNFEEKKHFIAENVA